MECFEIVLCMKVLRVKIRLQLTQKTTKSEFFKAAVSFTGS